MDNPGIALLTLGGYTHRFQDPAKGLQTLGKTYVQYASFTSELGILAKVAHVVHETHDGVQGTAFSESAPKTSDGYGWRIAFRFAAVEDQIAVLFPYAENRSGTMTLDRAIEVFYAGDVDRKSLQQFVAYFNRGLTYALEQQGRIVEQIVRRRVRWGSSVDKLYCLRRR